MRFFLHILYFSLNWPLRRFSHRVVMSVSVSVWVYVFFLFIYYLLYFNTCLGKVVFFPKLSNEPPHQWYWCCYPHRSRDSVSPEGGIFFAYFFCFNYLWRKKQAHTLPDATPLIGKVPPIHQNC